MSKPRHPRAVDLAPARRCAVTKQQKSQACTMLSSWRKSMLPLLVLFNGMTAFPTGTSTPSPKIQWSTIDRAVIQTSCRQHGKTCLLQIPPIALTSRTTTQLQSSKFWDNNTKEPQKSSIVAIKKRVESFLVLASPAAMATAAFLFYPETYGFYHDFVTDTSGKTWTAVDGGLTATQLIGPAMNGPLASFISLLFGTLTSMTVGALYQRLAKLNQAAANLLEDVRLAEIHFNYFPGEYRHKAIVLIQQYQAGVAIYFDSDADPSAQQISQIREKGRVVLEELVTLLHEISIKEGKEIEIAPRILDQAYDTMNRIFRTRSEISAAYDATFPIWHYGNLALLASAICIIFLVLTDSSPLQFLGALQLRLCWSMLIGTISILTAVLYDLNAPLSGVFQLNRPGESASLRILLEAANKESRIGSATTK